MQNPFNTFQKGGGGLGGGFAKDGAGRADALARDAAADTWYVKMGSSLKSSAHPRPNRVAKLA